jgi:hypothetical protein
MHPGSKPRLPGRASPRRRRAVLALLASTAILWLRSYWVGECIGCEIGGTTIELNAGCARGEVCIEFFADSARCREWRIHYSSATPSASVGPSCWKIPGLLAFATGIPHWKPHPGDARCISLWHIGNPICGKLDYGVLVIRSWAVACILATLAMWRVLACYPRVTVSRGFHCGASIERAGKPEVAKGDKR